MPTLHNIFTCAVFAGHHLFQFWPSNLFCFTLLSRMGIICCFLQKSFSKKNRAELFDCAVSNDMSKVTHQLVCIVLTQCFCFASSVCFGSFKNVILSGFLRDWCCFPSRRLLYTSICLSIYAFLRSMFAFILLFVDFVRYHDMIQIYRCSCKKSVDYFMCSICRHGIDQALFNQLKVFGQMYR